MMSFGMLGEIMANSEIGQIADRLPKEGFVNPVGDKDQGDFMDTVAAKLIEKIDIDGDEMIDIKELNLPEEIFAMLDADRDGLLSKDELKSVALKTTSAIKSLGDVAGSLNKLPAPSQIQELMGGDFQTHLANFKSMTAA